MLLLFSSLYIIRQTLFIFVVALLLAYLLYPLVSLLENRIPGRSKIPALAIVYLLLIATIGGVGFAVGSKVAVQANALAEKIPEILSRLEQPLVTGAAQSTWARLFTEIRLQIVGHARDFILPISNALFSLVSHAEMLLFVVLVPILSFFFLKDGRILLSPLLDNIVAGSRREIFKDIANDLHLLLAQYMRALVMLGLSASVTYSLFFWIIGLPYGLLLGAIAFFFEFIPMIGPLTSCVIVLLVAGLSGFGHIFWILLFLAAFRLFQDYVLYPLLLSKGIELHPLLVIFGVLAGGQLAGIPGAFLSVPVIATLRIIYRQMQKQRSTPAVPIDW